MRSPTATSDLRPQRFGWRIPAGASLRFGVLVCAPVHAQVSRLPQRGQGIFASTPSPAVGIQRSTFTWQPGAWQRYTQRGIAHPPSNTRQRAIAARLATAA